jgi:uncharacterized protein with HEPN domain
VKDDRLYLIHILESIQKIEAYPRDGYDAFMSSGMAQDAVIRNFEIIGEATKRVSEPTRRSATQVPWRQMAGFRDVLIHKYPDIDYDEGWSIVTEQVPDVKPKVEALLRDLGGPFPIPSPTPPRAS